MVSTYEALDDFGKILEAQKQFLSQKDAESLREVAKILLEAVEDKNVKSKSIKTTENATRFIIKVVQQMKRKDYMAEMALSYIISYQEGYVKDYLMEIFCQRPEIIKSAKNVSYDDVLSFKSISTLKRSLAERETESLGYGGIDDLNVYLQKKFNINMENDEFWPIIREASYRRNLIIHNRGIVNEMYRKKIGGTVSKMALKTDGEYIKRAADAIITFFNWMHMNMFQKLKLRRR